MKKYVLKKQYKQGLALLMALFMVVPQGLQIWACAASPESQALAQQQTPEEADDAQDMAQNTEIQPFGNNARSTLDTIDLKWKSASDGTISNDTAHVSTPATNEKITLEAELSYRIGSTPRPAGAVKIAIPRSIYQNWNGTTYTKYLSDIGIELNTSKNSFKAEIVGDNIVLSNTEELESNFLYNITFKYMIDPIDAKSGTMHSMQATLNIQSNPEIKSNALTSTIHTQVKTGTVTKSSAEQTIYKTDKNAITTNKGNGYFTSWQSAWGNASGFSLLNPNDYYYVFWLVEYTAPANSTQPYTIEFQDTLENPPTDTRFLGFTAIKESNTKDMLAGTVSSALTVGDLASITIDQPSNEEMFYSAYAVAAYPKLNWDNMVDDKSLTFENKMDVTLSPKDGSAISISPARGIYTIEKKAIPPYEDYLTLSKIRYKSLGQDQVSDDQNQYGAADCILNGENVTLGYQVSAHAMLLGLTNGGSNDYNMTLTDDNIVLGNDKLKDEDYRIKNIEIYWTQYKGSTSDYPVNIEDEANFEDTDYTSYADLKILVRKRGNPAYEDYATLQRTGKNNYSLNKTGSPGTTSDTANKISFEGENIVGVRIVQEGKVFRTTLSLGVGLELIATDNVKAITQKAVDLEQDPEKCGVTLTNQAEIMTTDYSNHASSQVETSATYLLLKGYHFGSIEKTASAPNYDDSASKATIEYTTAYSSEYKNSYYWLSADKQKTYVEQEREGTFYDLLPRGMTVDASTVALCVGGDTTRKLTHGNGLTVRQESNWENSGSTMLIVEVKLPDNMDGYTITTTGPSNTQRVTTGYTLSYTAEYGYVDMAIYGKTNKLNTIAYQTKKDKLANGGVIKPVLSPKNKQYYASIDAETGNTCYGEVSTDFAPTYSLLTGFIKHVREGTVHPYGQSASVQQGGQYSYRLLYANIDNKPSTELVFYDVLESAPPSGQSQWKGTFQGVDVSTTGAQNLDAKIYYATRTNLASMDPADYKDLTNDSIWSLTRPAQDADVTAIAVDCSKDTAGGSYTLNVAQSVFVTIHMLAPDHAAEGTQANTHFADNVMHGSVTRAGDKPMMLSSGATQMALHEQDISIEKTSNPASGNQSKPASVQRGDAIAYTLELKNQRGDAPIASATVEDAVPDMLEFDESQIAYYYQSQPNAKQLITDSTPVTVSRNGNTLTFHIQEIAVNDAVHIVIPTVVSASAKSGTTIINQAQILKYNDNGCAILSNETVHRISGNAPSTGNNNGTSYTVTYDANGGTGSHKDTGLLLDSTYTVKTIAATGILYKDHTFVSWNTKADGTGTTYTPSDVFKIPGNVTLYAQWKTSMLTTDHVSYIIGYPDGNVIPQGDITRAEVATIFFRLLTEEARNANWSSSNAYSDVSAQWYNNAASTMSKAGIVNGYPDGTFGGARSITRAEFAAIAARFDSEAYAGENKFSDIAGHWAAEYINRAAQKGWILGYEDGTFHPDQDITRAEAVTLINRVLGRDTIVEMHQDMRTWPDNQPSAWYYKAMQEATNSHEYSVREAGETWTKIVTDPDWLALEKK